MAKPPHASHARESLVRVVSLARTARFPRRLWRALDLLGAAGEVVLFMPIGGIAVALGHSLLGALPTILLVAAICRWHPRPSVRAIAWICGGVYGAVLGLATGNSLAVLAHTADPLAVSILNAASFIAYSSGLTAAVLTVALPVARATSTYAPSVALAMKVWAMELTKGAIGGMSVGAALAAVLSVPPTIPAVEEGGSQLLLVAVATAVGLVAGGLRADTRLRALVRDRLS